MIGKNVYIRFPISILIFLFIKILKYFMRAPLFTYLLSITMKLSSKYYPKRQVSITFIITLFLNRFLKIFNNEWALYLLIRSFYSYFKYIIPSDLQPPPLYAYFIIHTLCCTPLNYLSEYSSNKLWYLFEKCIGENRLRWETMLGRHNHHSMLPNCGLVVHTSYPQSCLKSGVKDVKDRFMLAFPYFLEVILGAKLLVNINRILVPLKAGDLTKFSSNLQRIIKSVLKDTLSSSIYFVGGIMSVTRIPCAVKWLFHTLLKQNEYDYVGYNNMPFMVTLCSVMGVISLSFSDRPKQTDINISVLWNALLNLFRVAAGLKGSDDEKYHWILGSEWYRSFMVAMSMSLLLITYKNNPKAMKGWERTIFQNYLLA